MPSLSSQDLLETRTQYAAAALALYCDGGTAAVTMRAVADRLGVSHTLVYRYYRNKTGLLSAARRICLENLAARIYAAVATQTDPEHRLVAMIQADVDWVLEAPAEYQLMFMNGRDAFDTDADMEQTSEQIYAFSLEVIEAYLQSVGRDAAAKTLFHLGWAGIHGIFMLEITGQLNNHEDATTLLGPMIKSIYGLDIQLNAPKAHQTGARRPI